MPKLLELFARTRKVLEQQREIASLRDEVERLRAQNERLNSAMRRCIPCEYRLEVVGKR